MMAYSAEVRKCAAARINPIGQSILL